MILTDKGISEVKGFLGYKEQLEELFRSVFGKDLDLSDYTPQSQLISLLANQFSDLELTLVSALNQLDPNTATGQALDNFMHTFGLSRLESTHSVVTGQIKGVQGTYIPPNSRVKTTSGEIFYLRDGVTIDGSGVMDGTFIAQEKGNVEAKAGTLATIIDNTLGWVSVDNLNDSINGREKETDEEVRRRKDLALASLGVDNLQAVIGAISQVDGVTDVEGVENSTGGGLFIQKDGSLSSTTSPLPIKPHSSYLFVSGGAETDIAEAYGKKKGAEATNGDVSVNTTYSSVPVNFARFSDTEIIIKLDIKKLSNFPNDGEAKIKKDLRNYMEGDFAELDDCSDLVRVANSIYVDDLYQIVKMTSGVRINALTLALKSAPTSPLTKYEGEFNERIVLDTVDLGVV